MDKDNIQFTNDAIMNPQPYAIHLYPLSNDSLVYYLFIAVQDSLNIHLLDTSSNSIHLIKKSPIALYNNSIHMVCTNTKLFIKTSISSLSYLHIFNRGFNSITRISIFKFY